MSRVIFIASDRNGWHSTQLARAFAAHGYSSRVASLHDCTLTLSDDFDVGIGIPGFGDDLPIGVLVRGVPGGTLQEIVLHLDILHGLRELGIPIHNDPRGIERAVDKGMTSFLLRRSGVPTPPAWVTSQARHARTVVEREIRAGHPLVVKPLFGSQGAGIMRVTQVNDLPDIEDYHNVYYLQRYIPSARDAWHDWRIFVVAGRAIAAMRREGATWINNVATGASCHAVILDGPMRRVAEDAVRVLELDYAGVDVIRDPNGKLWVVEVNSVPAWSGLQSVCEIRIADQVAHALMARIESSAAVSAGGCP